MVEIHPARPSDSRAIADLMRATFALPADSPAISPAHLEWRLWQPHPLTPSPRAWIAEQDGAVAASVGSWVSGIRTSKTVVEASHPIDWVSSGAIPGAGRRAMDVLMASYGYVFNIAGSDVARRLFVRMGFEARTSVTWLSASLEHRLSRLLPFVSARFGVGLPRGWEWRPSPAAEIPRELFPAKVGSTVRSTAILEYFLRCPSLSGSLCGVLHREGRPHAYFVLVRVGAELRLADYGPDSLDEETALVLGRAVLAAARKFPGATRLRTAISEEPVCAGLVRAGFRVEWEKEILSLIRDPTVPPQVRVTLFDWDELYL